MNNPTYEETVQMIDVYISKLKKLAEINPLMAKESAKKSLIATGMWDEDGHYIGLEKLNK